MMKGIIAFSVHSRWLVLLLTSLVAGVGVWALLHLPIDAVPDITNNQVQINSYGPALSVFEMEKQVTYPIENAIAGIPGLEYTRSLTRNGFSQVTAVFADKVDIYFARQQVNERLQGAREAFPLNVETRMGPVATGLSEIYMWSVSYSSHGGDEVSPEGEPGWQSNGDYLTPEGQRLRTQLEMTAYLRTVQDWIIKPQLRTVPGVAGVDSLGGYVKEYHVQPDPAKVFALNLSFADIASEIAKNNRSRGAGYVERNGEGLIVRSSGRLETVEDLAKVVVSTRNGTPVRVEDIAEVGVGRELRSGSASLNGEEVVIGTALMLIGANSREVSAAVDAKLKDIRKSLPPGIEANTILNRTQLVDATIKTIAKNLSEGAALVILVLFVMLNNFRAALVTALIIPLTMLVLAIGMRFGNISANLMSLGALDFGLIADGAIIVAENSLRRLGERQSEAGRPLTMQERFDTLIDAAVEMRRPTVFGQVIIILVYLPILTFSGVEGKMFQPMALTVILALVSEFLLSMTFFPAMLAVLLSRPVHESENAVVLWLKSHYEPILARTMQRPWRAIAIGIVSFVAAAVLYVSLGQEFIPTLDEKNIAMQANRIPSASLTQAQSMQFEIESALRTFPEVDYVFSKTGTAEIATDPMPPNLSDVFIMLKPESQWPDPSLAKDKLIGKMAQKLQELPGNAYEFTQPIQLRFNELLAGVRGDLAVKVFGDDFDTMLKAANQIASILGSVKGAVDVKVEQVVGLPVLDIAVDKRAISRLGLSIEAVQDVIGAAIGGERAGVVFEGDRRFPIIVRLQDNLREDAEALKSIPVSIPAPTGARGAVVPLKQVAKFSIIDGQNQISRENGRRRVVVSANVRGRDIASVVADAQAKIEARVKLPAGYWISWGGQFENLQAAQARLALVVPVCFFLIFLLLYSALGAVRDALLVFSAVPLALPGGVLALWLRDMPMSVSAAVGFIALSGVAVLNGLVMRTYIHQLMDRGVPELRAIREGALTRLRPVVMTALVASLGFVPMALATSTGAEVQRPIATVVIGGLISATLLTLIVLPALFSVFSRAPTPSTQIAETAS